MSWTAAEVAAYKPRKDAFLESLYEIAGAASTDPESRANYLRKSGVTLTKAERILVRREATKAGNNAELALLEDLAIAAHEAQPLRKVSPTPPKNI